ncbi:hypothetical protein FRX31_017549 [Thalictrum thalictroides]|uniref:SMP domain-containing protein n=1 Tax=Thalictrum thalictroides TaxID=46969 RepID=A0A7J6W8G4_THATH|nr:hypothetical protein FRX31_017549 [Thalictrum thalictroides]
MKNRSRNIHQDKVQLQLEAASVTVGDRPVDQSDVAAIEEAEMRATQRNVVPSGGVGGEEAQWAAARNAELSREEDKTKLSDVLLVVKIFH